MKAFITGADGLLGANLTRELISRGIAVRVLIEPGSKAVTLEGLDIERVEGNLLAGSDGLAKAMEGCDAVFHCAAITNMAADPDLTWKVNLDGTRNVLDAAKSAGVKRFVHTGSGSSFQPGPIDNPGDENSPFPEVYRGAAYMESKHQSMKLVREYVGKGLNAVVTAPTFILGAHDSRPSGGELIRQFVTKKLPFVTPGGRNFVFAADAAKCMANALEKGAPGEVFIMAGPNHTYMEFFTEVARQAGINPPKGTLPAAPILAAGAVASVVEKLMGKRLMFNYRMAKFAQLSTYLSGAKAERELGLTRTPIETMIAESIRALKQYGHL